MTTYQRLSEVPSDEPDYSALMGSLTEIMPEFELLTEDPDLEAKKRNSLITAAGSKCVRVLADIDARGIKENFTEFVDGTRDTFSKYFWLGEDLPYHQLLHAKFCEKLELPGIELDELDTKQRQLSVVSGVAVCRQVVNVDMLNKIALDVVYRAERL